MSETKHLLLFIGDDYLKEKILENLKMFSRLEKPAKYEMNIQDITTSIKELGRVILNRYLSEEQK